MDKHSQGIAKSNSSLSSKSYQNENSSILKPTGICEGGLKLPQVMTDDDLIKRLFPEYIHSS
ncbi:MAG TPA: hypothetical protein VIM70_04450 [Clostridium sp.]|uniref:hypothetical protein n=1 Tax=Clostridium sp. TaxID=1506 RepID=UPI002F9357A3